ncbi:MAG: carbohydrate ABC transporter permease, partial [Bacteroidota bacterium]
SSSSALPRKRLWRVAPGMIRPTGTQILRTITLPLLRPTILFVMVISTIKSLQIFVEMYTMTKGGPLNSTLTVVYLIFSNAFEKTDSMGYGAALAYILFAIIAVLSFIQMKVLGKKE